MRDFRTPVHSTSAVSVAWGVGEYCHEEEIAPFCGPILTVLHRRNCFTRIQEAVMITTTADHQWFNFVCWKFLDARLKANHCAELHRLLFVPTFHHQSFQSRNSSFTMRKIRLNEVIFVQFMKHPFIEFLVFPICFKWLEMLRLIQNQDSNSGARINFH